MTDHPSSPDAIMARALGVCWHSPSSDRWPCGPLRLCAAPRGVTHGPCVRISGHTERWHGQPWHRDEDGTEWKP